MGKICQCKMQVGVLGIRALLVVAFQFYVKALLLGKVDEIEGVKVVSRIRAFISCNN